MQPRLVTLTQLARTLGWTRPTTWYWLVKTGVETVEVPGLPYIFVRADELALTLFTLRQARARRRHDGHGQHGRPRRSAEQ